MSERHEELERMWLRSGHYLTAEDLEKKRQKILSWNFLKEPGPVAMFFINFFRAIGFG